MLNQLIIRRCLITTAALTALLPGCRPAPASLTTELLRDASQSAAVADRVEQTLEAVRQTVPCVAANGGRYMLAVFGATPGQDRLLIDKDLEPGGNNETTRGKAARLLAEQVIDEAEGQLESALEEPSRGTDVFGAMRAAASDLGRGEGVRRILWIQSDGLHAAPPWSLRRELGRRPVADLIRELDQLGLIPDLSGVEVVWHGVGITADDALSAAAVERIKEFWARYLEAAGTVKVELTARFSRFTCPSASE